MKTHISAVKLAVICAWLFAGSFLFTQNTFAQKIQDSSGSYLAAGDIQEEKDILASGLTGTQKQILPQISERMLKKVRELEKIAGEVKGQDDDALEKISGKIYKSIKSLPMAGDLLAAVKDKQFDWRVRYLLIAYKSQTATKSKINKYAGDFIEIMRDKAQHDRIRALSALVLSDVSKENVEVRKAMAEIAKSSDTPSEVLKSLMAVVGSAGIDDADALMKLTERGPADINEVGINLNAVRALGKSKDPRAIGYLIKIFDESVPDSYYQITAIQELRGLIREPENRTRVEPLVIPRFLKLLDNRSSLGISRREAAEALSELQVKEAADPIIKWFLPANGTSAVEGGGGNRVDAYFGARALVNLGDKRAIPVLEKTIKNFAADSRWSWTKVPMEKDGQKFPDDHQDYKHLKECLAALKKQK